MFAHYGVSMTQQMGGGPGIERGVDPIVHMMLLLRPSMHGDSTPTNIFHHNLSEKCSRKIECDYVQILTLNYYTKSYAKPIFFDF